jgi:hypothetical protein
MAVIPNPAIFGGEGFPFRFSGSARQGCQQSQIRLRHLTISVPDGPLPFFFPFVQ